MGYKVYDNLISVSPAFLLLLSMILLKRSINFLSLFLFCINSQNQQSVQYTDISHPQLVILHLDISMKMYLKRLLGFFILSSIYTFFLKVIPRCRAVLTSTSLNPVLYAECSPSLGLSRQWAVLWLRDSYRRFFPSSISIFQIKTPLAEINTSIFSWWACTAAHICPEHFSSSIPWRGLVSPPCPGTDIGANFKRWQFKPLL